jgi:hypothetical protein
MFLRSNISSDQLQSDRRVHRTDWIQFAVCTFVWLVYHNIFDILSVPACNIDILAIRNNKKALAEIGEK